MKAVTKISYRFKKNKFFLLTITFRQTLQKNGAIIELVNFTFYIKNSLKLYDFISTI